MAPTCSRAAIRFVATILLVSSVVNAVALPHPVPDSRSPLVRRDDVVLPDAVEVQDEKPKNVFDTIGKLLNSNSGWQIFKDFWARLFGPQDEYNDDEGGDGDETTAASIIVTSTPASKASTLAVVIPTDSNSTPTVKLPVGSETVIFGKSTTAEPEGSGIFPILPWGDVPTAIVLSPTDVADFSTVAEISLPSRTGIAAALTNTDKFSVSIPSELVNLAPAAIFTKEFSVTIPTELASKVPHPISGALSFSASAGVGVSAAANVTVVIDPSLVTAPIKPTPPSNETALNIASVPDVLTSLIIVTATVTPSPALVTDVASPSAGTGLPLATSESQLWTNSAAIVPVVPIVPIGTGSGGAILPVATEIPTVPKIPTGTGIGLPLADATGSPIGTAIPEIPLFPNATKAADLPGITAEVQLNVTVTSVPEEVLNLTVSIPAAPSAGYGAPSALPVGPIHFDAIPGEAPIPTALPGPGSAVLPVGTQVPVSELPVLANSSTIEVVLPPMPAPSAEAQVSASAEAQVSGPAFIIIDDPTEVVSLIKPDPTAAPSAETELSLPVPLLANATAEVVLIATPVPVSELEPEAIIASAAASVGADISIALPALPLLADATPSAAIETAPAALDVPPAPPVETDAATKFPGLLSLRSICTDPSVRVITLPLLSKFYGPNAYPSLFSFPGCTAPNARQKIQAPGLLDCSALGKEVQRCQAGGRKVLLSIKGDGLAAASGNAGFGDPEKDARPFGKSFGSGGGLDKKMKRKRHDEPVETTREEEPIVLAPGPVILNGTTPLPPVKPSPVGPDASSSPFPNLFDAKHPSSAFALTLFSLFGEGHTERADLRPLGPDAPSGASPESLNRTDWINPILTALQRPLGEEVVVDGFDVQLPAEWKGKYQDTQFQALVKRLKELHRDAWKKSGGVVGGPGDLGADGKGVVYFGWMGGNLKVRSRGLQVQAKVNRVGWREWKGE